MNQRSNTVQYDDFSETFGESRRDMHWSEIDEILSYFLSNHMTGNMADIGCGNGRLLKHILEHPKSEDFHKFTKYVGLDSSSQLLQQARSDKVLQQYFSPEWYEGDMRDLKLKIGDYGPFEGLFFIASFHHLRTREDRLLVLLQAKKLLSKKGEIIMINWNLTDPSQVKYESSQTEKYPDGSADFDIKIGSHTRFYHAFSMEEYTSLAEEIGLQAHVQFGERNSIVYFS